MHEAGSDDVPFDEALNAVTTSFATWGAVGCGFLEFFYQGLTNEYRAGYLNGKKNINVIIWREARADWPHQRGVIAVTTVTFCNSTSGEDCPDAGVVLDADIELNGHEFDFTTTRIPTRVRFDIANTVTHEIGHFVGLDHTPVDEATMFASAPPGEVRKASLHEDDIDGFCAIYPMVDMPEGCGPFEVEGDYFLTEDDLQDDGDDISSGGESDFLGCSAVPGTEGSGGWGVLFALAALAWRRRRLD